MANVSTVYVTWYWNRTEPDGSACVMCGDMCLLEMWEMFMRINKGIAEPQPSVVICGACHQAEMEK